jgi:hypothetical protein
MIDIIKNSNGLEYALVGTEGEYSFLESCCVDNQYVVAWKLHTVGDGLHEWEQGHYFYDLFAACDCFVKKCIPFDNPCRINAYCQVCNIECRHRSDR